MNTLIQESKLEDLKWFLEELENMKIYNIERKIKTRGDIRHTVFELF